MWWNLTGTCNLKMKKCEMNTSSGSSGSSFFDHVSYMQEETLENIASQIENGKCAGADGGNICTKFSLHAKALTISRQ